MRETPITIPVRGEVRISDDFAVIVAQGENIVALRVDMDSKRCEVWTESSDDDGTPILYVQRGEHGIKLDDSPEMKGKDTLVAFPEFKGYEVFLSGISKYTLSVVLVRKDGAEECRAAVAGEGGGK